MDLMQQLMESISAVPLVKLLASDSKHSAMNRHQNPALSQDLQYASLYADVCTSGIIHTVGQHAAVIGRLSRERSAQQQQMTTGRGVPVVVYAPSL